ncbi:MAG TPA: potassium transporter TrkA [Oceanithermus profundus]|uniref:Potassium transporter TrkA n=1 Tax=Oceanithermus profundus TaxID=187137 RepID=A0A7C4ZID4_9DEIN|nr:potassium transporter TrkA [Oceanithermus profundus]
MRVEETVLPGVGHKFTVVTHSGDKVVVLVHQTGVREVYFYRDDEDDAVAELELSDEEARELGAILAGVLYRPEVSGDVRSRVKELTIEWIRVEPGHPCVNRPLADWLARVPGVHVLGILREDEALYPNPPPDLKVEVGDVLIAAGSRAAIDSLKRADCRG